MGFFKKNKVCGACNKEVGINRFKIKKSDAWVCPSCFTEAGGLGVVDVTKITIEEIKAIVDKKAARRAEGPLSSAEGMYQYCVDNKFGSGFNSKWGVKHFRILENNLMDGEKVQMVFIGIHNYQSATKHDNNFAYAITNKRIMFGQKTITGEKFKAVDHEKINDISFETGMLYGFLTIDTPQEKFKVALDKPSAKSINNSIHQVLDNLKNSTNEVPAQPQSTSAPISVADELKTFKELFDTGVITEEEFNAKKKLLLGI
ncbi:PH domain-containing protein [Bacillus bombysepticus]|uniref:PH domain-containing protein n=1 Tax=Bacillus bombysepticus TaxID=658666 RepID=UPI003017664E